MAKSATFVAQVLIKILNYSVAEIRLFILQLLFVTIFLIFIGTVVLEYRGIGSLLGVCILFDGVGTIVGSLHLERDPW